MTIIYIAENNCQCLAVTFKNNGMIRVQKLKIFPVMIKILYTKSIPWKHLLARAKIAK